MAQPTTLRPQAPPATLERGQIRLHDFLLVLLQLVLVLGAIHLFRIEESRKLQHITALILGGFALHAWLPLDWRRPFYVLLSLSSIGVVLHWEALWLIGCGAVLIGLCHVPLPYRLRVGLVVAVSLLLAAWRGGWVTPPSDTLAATVLPVLGGMFMFRLALYLYDLRFEKKPASWSERLGYFFMLPNACFPFFPVVDYQAWRRTWYDKPAVDIYQKGLHWLYRGTVQLILYRVVYYNFTLAPQDVQSLGQLVQYMVTTYLLYLRVSGLFHLIVGILCLFGYNLAETHHLYYLATSFNDYWRRINIYWKDFMMKLFYYPAFMRVKRWGMTTGLVLATIWVFFGTWALHSYQWFWLRGEPLFTLTDTLFWAILGGLVVYNAVQEARKGRARKLTGETTWQWQEGLRYALKVTGMIVTITTLWTLWSTPKLNEFISLMSVMLRATWVEWAWLLVGLAGLVLVLFVGRWRYITGGMGPMGQKEPSLAWARSVVLAGSVVLLLMGWAPVRRMLEPAQADFLSSLQETGLNQRDEETLERGYYEGLMDFSLTSGLVDVQVNKPADWGVIGQTTAIRRSNGLSRYELLPNQQLDFKGISLTTNAWGMRDREYTREKPDSTYRMALLGKSYEMGGGMAQPETFEQVAEDRLNREFQGGRYRQYEILNFAVGGYTLLDIWVQVQEKVFAFQPDAVLYTGHSVEERILMNRLAVVLPRDLELPPFLAEIRQKTGIKQGMDRSEVRRRLAPYADDLIRWGYAEIVAACRAHGALPVWVFVPRTDDAGDWYREQHARLTRIAREAGFQIIDLDGAYGTVDPATLALAPWDKHANAQGHRLLGDRLYEQLIAQAPALGLLPEAPADALTQH
jgi:hypothetical protein